MTPASGGLGQPDEAIAGARVSPALASTDTRPLGPVRPAAPPAQEVVPRAGPGLVAWRPRPAAPPAARQALPRPRSAPLLPPSPLSRPQPARPRPAWRPVQSPAWWRARAAIWRRVQALPWPLGPVLAVQAAGSLRLLRANTAFQDEALYLWAGHMEWSHWLHGTSIPLFPTFFSGAPVLYPPLGALADSVGGLVAARVLSLAFMLGATALLWGTACRLYGRRAAFFAAASWALLGPTVQLGAFATYDAMSLFFMALAAWCATRAGPRADQTGWMMATAIALALANATKYASALFDPVIIAIVVLCAWPHGEGVKAAVSRGAALAAYVTAIVILLVTIGGGYYEAGIGQTTLTRMPGSDSALGVLRESWAVTGPVLVVALAGVLIGLLAERSRESKLLLIVLAGAASLVPLEQARIHTLTSLVKHVDFGAWFAAIVAGYAVDRAVGWFRPAGLRAAGTGACVLLLLIPARIGSTQSLRLAQDWPNAARFDATLGRLVGQRPGRALVETPSLAEYYLGPLGTRWGLWSSTRSIVLPSGQSISGVVGAAGNPAVYARFIHAGYFRWVALDYLATRRLDQAITADLAGNPAYRVVARVPYGAGSYVIWQYAPRRPEPSRHRAPGGRSRHHHRRHHHGTRRAVTEVHEVPR